MQKETGRRGEAPMIHRDTPQEKAAAVSEEGGLFSEEMKGQLRSIFDKMETPLVLELFLDESDLSAELRQYMDFLAGLTDKLSVTVSDASGEDLPLVRVLRADGTWTGLSFHGVPGGHEFTSFVLGLYNASGPGQQLDSDTLDRIRGLDHPVRMQILVSLSCTMCPELVTSAQRIAALSPKVQAEVYDLARYPALKERWNVMSVPCLVINGGEQVLFGKKSAAQLAAVI
jgi:thioredoxin reductase (NADPH)